MSHGRLCFQYSLVAAVIISAGHDLAAQPNGAGGPNSGVANPVFVFQDNWDGGLFLSNIDGTEKVRLTRNPRTYDWAPTWSPDMDPDAAGHQGWIAFFRQYEPGYIWGDLFLIPSDGSGTPILLRSYVDFSAPPPSGNDYSLSWSPDGSRILYEADGQAWVVKLGSGEVQNLGFVANTPTFSPDLSPDPGYQGTIAYRPNSVELALADVDIDENDVLTVSNHRWLTDSPTVSKEYPVWSPDGQHIAFYRRLTDAPIEDNQRGISVINVASGEIIDVVDTLYSQHRATWSPDGAFIAYADAYQIGNRSTTDIFVVSPWLAGSPINVTNTGLQQKSEISPNWNPAWE